ncbi:transferase hexapeptide (six repeat-containing protein) [Butyrivibrio sp. TB]|nr:transferase hexapeptide (six repeat-containing protein) [Butyrivibrio sp. TB]
MKFGASITHNWSDHDNFLTPPILGHGIMGIIMSSDAIIGHNVFISQQVTIGASNGGSPTIGDNVYIGPGAKIFGKIKIGNISYWCKLCCILRCTR